MSCGLSPAILCVRAVWQCMCVCVCVCVCLGAEKGEVGKEKGEKEMV